MKQYVIDGLRPEDYTTLKGYLDEHCEPAFIDGIYWLELGKHLLTFDQKAHQDCHPHVFALELDYPRLSCELLVRIKKSIKCDCMGYATPKQREWLIATIDAILDKLKISI